MEFRLGNFYQVKSSHLDCQTF